MENKNKINNNGYEYVDLGLPSGTLWATCNVGAKKPSEYGLYFQWGDTIGYTKEQVGKDKRFFWTDYKFSINGSDSNFSKYTATGAKRDLEDDAANANMGGDWKMPTDSQIQELIYNTISKWTAQDGVNGKLFISKNDPSKSIFIPAAGFAYDGEVLYIGGIGYVWSSVLGAVNVYFGKGLCLDSGFADLGYGNRCNGFSIRGVI